MGNLTKYAEYDIAECNLFAWQKPEQLRLVAMMAVLSIRQHWHRIGEQLIDVKVNGFDSKYLFGFKRQSYRYITENLDVLYAETFSTDDPVELLDLWSTVPGLGLAKAGFVVQLTRNMIGCIDSHNARMYDISASQLRLAPRLSAKTRLLKLTQYVDLCKGLGGSERLWAQWCVHMARKYPDHYNSPRTVSKAHVTYLHDLWS